MLLLSEHLLAKGVQFEAARNSDDGDGQTDPNEWQHSDAQKWCRTFATNSSYFSLTEQGAMLGVKKTDNEESNLYSNNWGTSSLTSNDKMFFLSVRELTNLVGSYSKAPGLAATFVDGGPAVWWLRSPHAGSTSVAGAVDPYGIVLFGIVDAARAARPAFNLDLTSVLFTSAVVGGKPDGLNKVGDYNGNDWKLTLKDNSRNFAVTETTASGKPGDTITLKYTGATTGTNEYISVILADENGAKYYGRVAKPSGESGTVTLTIPTGLAPGSYTLYVFSEQCNGDYKTDYASGFVPVTLTVTRDTTAPTLTPGSTIRQSETAATVQFTSSEAGSLLLCCCGQRCNRTGDYHHRGGNFLRYHRADHFPYKPFGCGRKGYLHRGKGRGGECGRRTENRNTRLCRAQLRHLRFPDDADLWQ